MTFSSTLYCPAPSQASDVGFTSLGDIDRIGEAFSLQAHNMIAISRVQQYRRFRMRCLETTLKIVEKVKMPPRALVSVRLKRLDSIRRKIKRPCNNFSLGRMNDVIGVRIVCPDYQTARDLSQGIGSFPPPYKPKVKDYTHNPPANTGYRSIHHIIRFQQPLSETENITVRFEIQVRSYLQHQWAIWSEHQGEAIKIGSGSEEIHSELRDLSERIARWEETNPDKVQQQLPDYAGEKNIVLAWRQKHTRPACRFFQDKTDDAVKFLNYLETKYPAQKNNALLLVGVTTASEAESVLRITHPLYVANRIIAPEYWMPSDS